MNTRNKIEKLSIYIFTLTVFTVFFSYILSVKLSLVPSCIPFIDGCTSISRSGRYYPVNIFFKFFLFLSGFLILFYWYYNYIFFKRKIKLIKFNFILGSLSVLFLFLYLFFLGDNSYYYKFFRKIGIFIYLLFSVISGLILSIIYYKQKKIFKTKLVNIKLYLNFLLTISGIILFPFMIAKIENISEIRNIVSWNYFFLIQVNFLLSHLIWKNNSKS